MPLENKEGKFSHRRPQSAIRSRTSEGINQRVNSQARGGISSNRAVSAVQNNDHIQTQNSQGKKSKFLRRPLTQNNNYCAKTFQNEDQQLKIGKENKFQAMPRSSTRMSNRNCKSRSKHKEKLESFVNDHHHNHLKKSLKRAKNDRKEASLTVRQQSIDVLQGWQDHDIGMNSSQSPAHELIAVPQKEDFLPMQSQDMFNMSKALASEEDSGALQQISIFAMNRLASLSQTFSSPDKDSAAKNQKQYMSKKEPYKHLEDSLEEVFKGEKTLNMSLENAQDPQNEELMINIRVPFSKVRKLHQKLQKQNGAKKARQDQKYQNSPYMLANQINSRRMTSSAARRNNGFTSQSTHNGRHQHGTLDSDKNDTLRKRMDPLLQADPLKQMKILDKKRAGQKQELNLSPKVFQPNQVMTPGPKTAKNNLNGEPILDLDEIQLDFDPEGLQQENSMDVDLNQFDDKMQNILANDLARKIQLHESEQLLMNQELVPCRFCARKFSQSVLKKHQGVCKNVFGNKRVAFDAKKQRLGINAPIVLLSNGLSDVSPSAFLSRNRSTNATPSKQNGRNFLQEKNNFNKQKQRDGQKALNVKELAKKGQPMIVNGKLQLKNSSNPVQRSEQSQRVAPKKHQAMAKNYQIQNSKRHKEEKNRNLAPKQQTQLNESGVHNSRTQKSQRNNVQSSQSIRLKQHVKNQEQLHNQYMYPQERDARKTGRAKTSAIGYQTKDSTTQRDNRKEQNNATNTHHTSVETLKSKNETVQFKRQNKKIEHQNQRANSSNAHKKQSLYTQVECLKTATERALSSTNALNQKARKMPTYIQTPAKLEVKQLPLQSSQKSLNGPIKLQMSSKNEKKGQQFSQALRKLIESGKSQQENNLIIEQVKKGDEPQKVVQRLKERKRSLQQRSSRIGAQKLKQKQNLDVFERISKQPQIPKQDSISYENIDQTNEDNGRVESRLARRQSKYVAYGSGSQKKNQRSKSGGYQIQRTKTADNKDLKQNSVEIKAFDIDKQIRHSFEQGSRNSKLADELAEINKLSKEESQSMLKQLIRYNRQVLGLDSPDNFQNKSLREDLQDFSLVAQLDSGKRNTKANMSIKDNEQENFGNFYVDTEESKLSFEGESKQPKTRVVKDQYDTRRQSHLQAKALPEENRESLTAREKLRRIIQKQKMARQISRQNKTQRQKSASFKQK